MSFRSVLASPADRSAAAAVADRGGRVQVALVGVRDPEPPQRSTCSSPARCAPPRPGTPDRTVVLFQPQPSIPLRLAFTLPGEDHARGSCWWSCPVYRGPRRLLCWRQDPALNTGVLPWAHDLCAHYSQCPSRWTRIRRIGPGTPFVAQSRPRRQWGGAGHRAVAAGLSIGSGVRVSDRLCASRVLMHWTAWGYIALH
jgi:hypothetical protein